MPDVSKNPTVVNMCPSAPWASVLAMFESQAQLRPDASAVCEEQRQITYGELDARSNQVACKLQSGGIGPDAIVPVFLDRTLEMVIGVLGIMKAGAAYLPLVPGEPSERISLMVLEAEASVVVTNSSYAERFWIPTLSVDTCEAPASSPKRAGRLNISPEQRAYVIYTSGSTGTPKAVEATHGGLANLVTWHRNKFGVMPADRASHMAALGFDAAVWELWPYLASGASIHLVPPDVRLSPDLLRDWIVANRITISFAPTPMAERLMATEWPAETELRVLLTGGDSLHVYPPASLPFRVINNYGPTECTVVATSGEVPIERADTLPAIGAAIDNVCLYILDAQMQPVQDGEPGELYIGGSGVARSYLKRPAATAERFLPNPFNGGGRIYRSGDMVRRLPDGQLAFVGRIDDQIKLRGFRIEPDEVVFVLDSHPGVHASAVTTQDRGREKQLVAYVVPSGRAQLTRSLLQDHLQRRLPDYMVPSTFVLTDSLPLTSNGKVDRALLPPATADNTLDDAADDDDPRTVIEERITGLLAGLLHLPKVGREENFFMLGGHSLLGTQLIAHMRNIFGVEVPLRTLFERPTVAELAAEIESLILAKLDSQEPTADSDHYEQHA